MTIADNNAIIRKSKSSSDDFIMKPKVDYCFKELMRNQSIRNNFIAALLKKKAEEIKESELLPTEMLGDYADDKLGILDIRVALCDGTQLDLEMQITYVSYWKERTLFYLSRMYTSQLHRGDRYDKCKKCIHVSLLNFDLFPGEPERYHVVHLRRDNQDKELFSDLLELQILELSKRSPEISSDQNSVQEWIRFFGEEKKESFETMAKDNPEIAEAYEELQRLSADDIKRYQYEAREKAIRDYNFMMSINLEKGMEQGLQQGLQKGMEQGLQKGMEQGLRQGLDEARIKDISALMKTMGWSAETAMENLQIPQEKRKEYLDLLSGRSDTESS